MTSTKLEAIRDHLVVVSHADGSREELPADTVILSLGSKKNDGLIRELENGDWKFRIVGDAGKVGRIVDATRDAYQKARAL